MGQHITPLPVDVADVTILVDNFLDILLPSDEVAHRAPLHYDWSDREQLIAEHGYSLLLTVVREGVHAFVGGFHLTGGLFEPIIPRTIAELVTIGPDIIVPGHCTGWRATYELVRQLPDAYVQTSVGTRLHFG